MKNSRIRMILGSAFIVIILLIGGIAWYYKTDGQKGQKSIVIEIISNRDTFKSSNEYQTSKIYLGDFLKEQKLIAYDNSDYGMYIHTVADMKDDQAGQYWWSIAVNHESATNGAATIPLEDGSTYTLELKHGY